MVQAERGMLIFTADIHVEWRALYENTNWCRNTRGQELYRALVELMRPKLIICGHMHRPLREEFAGVPVISLGRGEILQKAREVLRL